MFEDALLKDIPYRLHNLTEASITLLVRSCQLHYGSFARLNGLSYRLRMHWIYCLRSTSVIAKQRNSNFLPGERKSSYFWINKIFFFFSGETMTGMDNLGYDANTENAVSGWIFVINAELDHIKIPFLLLYYKLTNNLIM